MVLMVMMMMVVVVVMMIAPFYALIFHIFSYLQVFRPKPSICKLI
jgi:hypothetical protein